MLVLDPTEGLVSPKQWFSTLAAHIITWEGEEALIPSFHPQRQSFI